MFGCVGHSDDFTASINVETFLISFPKRNLFPGVCPVCRNRLTGRNSCLSIIGNQHFWDFPWCDQIWELVITVNYYLRSSGMFSRRTTGSNSAAPYLSYNPSQIWGVLMCLQNNLKRFIYVSFSVRRHKWWLRTTWHKQRRKVRRMAFNSSSWM
jgi:hypothetical protein